MSPILAYYQKAKQYVLDNDTPDKDYRREIKWQDSVSFDKMTEDDFFANYIWVVLSSGLSNKAARSIDEKLHASFPDCSVVKHPLKRKAIEKMWKEFPTHYQNLKALRTDEERIRYIQSLYYMGAAISYHLAKNLGIPCAKPDRHLVRIAKSFGYSDVQQFCREIAEASGDKVSVVDLIIWRYANLVGTMDLVKDQAILM